MLCKIAELLTEVPAAGGLAPRCVNYLYPEEEDADIVIRTELYEPDYWPGAEENIIAYLESGIQFYSELIRYSGMMLHSSAVEVDGKTFLFSGPCGAGKSTHTKLWVQIFGERAQIINDDKPALRRIDGRWYVYGTPWCGKDGINLNTKSPLAGICFVKKAQENTIRRLDSIESLRKVISQTTRLFKSLEKLDLMMSHVDKLIREIPVFELENRPEEEAAWLSYRTMWRAAEENGL